MLQRGGVRMLAIIGLVLIALWIVGLALKVTAWFIHVALVIGILLIVFNFVTGRKTAAP
jgi:Family of unknown function (DUF5670)